MRNRNFRILEYDKIINELASHASCELGKKLCLKLRPSNALYGIKHEQRTPERSCNRKGSADRRFVQRRTAVLFPEEKQRHCNPRAE